MLTGTRQTQQALGWVTEPDWAMEPGLVTAPALAWELESALDAYCWRLNRIRLRREVVH